MGYISLICCKSNKDFVILLILRELFGKMGRGGTRGTHPLLRPPLPGLPDCYASFQSPSMEGSEMCCLHNLLGTQMTQMRQMTADFFL